MATINWSNVTDFAQLPAQANTASGGSFWVGMLYMIFAIILLVLMQYGFETALLVSAFLCLIIGIMFVYVGLVNFIYVLVFVGIILSVILYIIWGRR